MAQSGGLPSLNWIFEDTNQTVFTPTSEVLIAPSSAGQNYSLADANNYLYNALTLTDEAERKTNRHDYFYSLGHVLHFMGDMGQPEHVRLDQHLYLPNSVWYARPVNSLHFRSLYEKYTNEYRDEMISHLIDGVRNSNCASPRIPIAYPNPDIEITTAREIFDDESGKGLAEFTNHNFVSNDTNFDSLSLISNITTYGQRVSV